MKYRWHIKYNLLGKRHHLYGRRFEKSNGRASEELHWCQEELSRLGVGPLAIDCATCQLIPDPETKEDQ